MQCCYPVNSQTRQFLHRSQSYCISPKIILSRRKIVSQGIFGGVFGRGQASGGSTTQQQKDGTKDFTRPYQQQQNELVLSTAESEDGSGSARIVFRVGSNIDVDEMDVLCMKVGWASRSLAKLQKALQNSFLVASLHVVIARPEENETERLIGIARVTSDHVLNATIWDVVVDPTYQGQGLGKAIIEQVVKVLMQQEISNITLFADKELQDFYRGLGFEAEPEGIKGMFWMPR